MLTDLGPQANASNIDYEVTEVDVPLHSKNRRLVDYWTSNLDSDGIVHRRDIDPAQLKPVLGGLFIVELIDNGRDLLYRLVGSENERRLGLRCMGRKFTECYSQQMAAEQIAFHYAVFNSGRPAFLRGRLLGLDLEYVQFEASYLPMRRDDGGFQMLGGMYDLAEERSK